MLHQGLRKAILIFCSLIMFVTTPLLLCSNLYEAKVGNIEIFSQARTAGLIDFTTPQLGLLLASFLGSCAAVVILGNHRPCD